MAIHITISEAQTAWLCPGCDEVIEEPVTLYECGECGTIFSRENSADGNSHKCPDCQKFAGKLTTHGCSDCDEECEEVKAIEVDGEWVVIDAA